MDSSQRRAVSRTGRLAAAAAAAGLVRGLSDEQLGRSATLLAGRPPLTAEQIISNILIGHIDQHFGSIRQTIGS